MAVVSLCLVLYVSTQPRPLFLWAFIFNLRFRPFSIRRGRPFALSVFAPSCLCSLNTSGGGVHIVHVVYIRAGCLDAAPLGGAGGCFRAFVFCCTKRARACDTSNERANAAHGAKEQRGGGLFFSIRRGFCLRVCIVHVRPRRCYISCSFCIVSTRRARLYCIGRGGLFFSTRRGDCPRCLYSGGLCGRCTRAALFVFWDVLYS